MTATTDDGVRLAMMVSGPAEAPALLFLNSVGCTRILWDAQVEALAGDYRVITYDARGHGASDAPAGDYTIDRLARDALAVLDAAGVARAHLCGLSLGGVTAQRIATLAPARVDRLVIANTALRIGSEELWETRRRTVLDEGMEPIVEPALGRFFGEAFRGRRPDLVDRFADALRRQAPQGYAGCCAALRDADLTVNAAAIAAPTLVIGGTGDVSTPPAQAAALATAIAGASLELLDAAHLSAVEQPAAFTALVRRHLEAR